MNLSENMVHLNEYKFLFNILSGNKIVFDPGYYYFNELQAEFVANKKRLYSNSSLERCYYGGSWFDGSGSN